MTFTTSNDLSNPRIGGSSIGKTFFESPFSCPIFLGRPGARETTPNAFSTASSTSLCGQHVQLRCFCIGFPIDYAARDFIVNVSSQCEVEKYNMPLGRKADC